MTADHPFTVTGMGPGTVVALKNTFSALAPYTGARFVLANYGEQPMPITELLATDDDAGPVLPVTVGGVTAIQLPGAATLRGSHITPGIVVTDRIPVEGLDFVTLLGLAPGDARFVYRNGSELQAYKDHALNSHHMAMGSGNQQLWPGQTLANASGIATSISGAAYLCLGVIFDYGRSAAGMLVVGDSVYAHSYPTTGGIGLGQSAMFKAQAAGRLLGAANLAQDGQRHAESLTIARSLLASGLRPDWLVFAPWSVNSGTGPAVFDACWADTQAMVAECRAVGVEPVVCTLPPQGYNPDILARIATQNERVRGLDCTIADFTVGWDRPTMEVPADDNHWTAAGRDHAANILLAVTA